MRINVFTQSAIKIESAKNFYFDPYQIKTAYHDADYIFITHDHYDHYDEESIKNILTPTTLVIAPKCLEEHLKKITSNILLVEPAQTYTHDGLTFETVASYNLNKSYHPKENGYTGYKLRIEDKYFYIMGDTDATPEALNTKCDVCFIPIGGTYTMDVFEASEYLNKTMPEIAIPIHYGSIVGDINLYEELEKLTNPNIKLELYIK